LELHLDHVSRCPLRPRMCPNEGCGQQVSVQSTAFHLQHCTYEAVACDTCGAKLRRCDAARHAGRCPKAVVACPLMCGETMRREAVPAHIAKTAHLHSPCDGCAHRRLQGGGGSRDEEEELAADSPQIIYGLLLQTILDLRASGGAPRGSVRSGGQGHGSSTGSARTGGFPRSDSTACPRPHYRGPWLSRT
jgi:hypothetical protein